MVTSAREKDALVEQIVHGEADVWIVHLSSAGRDNEISLKGVMHHYQNYWFTSCRHTEDTTRIRKTTFWTYHHQVVTLIQLFHIGYLSAVLWTLG